MKKKLHLRTLIIILFFLSAGTVLRAQDAAAVVIDGNARFTVLTPALIRTEYAGDGIFENRRSFNIIDHNLPFTSYTTAVNDGWREIETDKVVLRYKQNSGIFGPENLIVNVKKGNEPIIAKPWRQPLSSYTQEAESARLFGGAKRASDHTGYRGNGFVGGLQKNGAGIEWNVRKHWEAGEYIVQFKYSNGMGSKRTISFYVDGVKQEQLTLDATTDWKEWKVIQTRIQLDYAPHSFKIVCDEGDTYNVNIDWINIIPVGKMNRICEAEHATLTNGASVSTEHLGYSGSGFVAKLTAVGPEIIWELNNDLPAGGYEMTIKYANGSTTGGHIQRSLSLYVNDGARDQVLFPITTDWKTWGTVKQTILLKAGKNTIRLSCTSQDLYRVNIDWIAFTPIGGKLPDENMYEESKNLGAWARGLDEKRGEIPLWDGFLSLDGWYLLDDSHTALHDGEGWVVDRSVHAGGYQDGYFFGYVNDFQTALKNFYSITGNPMLLPKWAFGIWYSINSGDYTNASYYQNKLLPDFRSNKTPLDVLVVDTDFRYPDRWNSWDWNNTHFPNPKAFFDWTKEQNLVVPLNVHPTIQNTDAKFAETNATAGGLIYNGDNRYHFDFTNKKHAEAYFNLHKTFDELGTRFWWFDQAEYPNSAIAGVPADTWINSLYAKQATDRGLRGFAFSRLGSGHMYYDNSRDPGEAWSEHRYTVHFTGDAYSEWDMLAFQSTFTVKEANIGLPYVTHDLGSYHAGHLDNDKYMRWVQFGTFQPIFRLHSKRGDRLPWHYPAVQQQAIDFIRLRHSLIHYTYTLARESSTGGLPIVRGMYFYYPEAPESYTFDRQYLYGEKILVSPVTTAGEVASTDVWFPEGKWTNFFTNETIIGPVEKRVSADYESMPVFVKAGGIIPLAPYADCAEQIAKDSLILKVYTGADGEFTLYEDEGENLNYQTGAYALTEMIYKETERKLSIKAQQGTYAGALEKRSYNLMFYNAGIPAKVYVNGEELSSKHWQCRDGITHISLSGYAVMADIEVVLDANSSDLSFGTTSPAFRLYPNPATDYVIFDVPEEAILNIYSTNGVLLHQEKIQKGKQKVNMSTYQQGTYIAKLKSSGLASTILFIKK